MATTYERLKKIVVEQLGVDEDEVKPEASFVDDLNADSLDLVELIMSLEEEFGTEISDEDAEKIRTVQDAVAKNSRSRTKISRSWISTSIFPRAPLPRTVRLPA